MDVYIFNDLNNLPSKVKDYADYIGERYDDGVTAKKISLIVWGIITALCVIFGLLFLLTVNHIVSLIISIILFFVAVCSAVRFCIRFESPPIYDLWQSDNNIICTSREDAIKNAVNSSRYGWLLDVKRAVDDSRVLYIRFFDDASPDALENNTTVKAVLFYENEHEKVITKIFTFNVELSTNKHNQDCIFIDLYNDKLIKYHSDSYNTGANYNLKTMEEFTL